MADDMWILSLEQWLVMDIEISWTLILLDGSLDIIVVLLESWLTIKAVSYTHLTLPTIYSV